MTVEVGMKWQKKDVKILKMKDIEILQIYNFSSLIDIV